MKIDRGDLQFRDVIKDLMREEPIGDLLDIGIGKGQIAEAYQDIGFRVVGVDHKPQELKLEGVKCYKVDISFDTLPFEDNSFDYVTCTEVLEHLENPTNLIREASRVLKENGIMILSTPNLNSLVQRLYYLFTGFFLRFSKYPEKEGHITPINFYLFKDLIKKNNLIIEKITYNRGWIPLLRLETKKNNLFGDIIIMKLRKKKGVK